MKRNFATEIFFIIILFLFGLYRYFSNMESVVLKVFSPTLLAVDLNGNRQFDSDEIICISGVQTFSDNLLDYNTELAKILGVGEKDALSMAYLTKNFSDSLLSDKIVKFQPDKDVQGKDCLNGDILVDNFSYRKKLLDEGYAYSTEYEYNKENFAQNLSEAKGLTPLVLNRKSHKYHKIGCKFGRTSQDYVVIMKEDLPDNAVPCKYCHRGEEKAGSSAGLTPQNVYPDRISDGGLKMFLTDMTNNLKVKNDCSSGVCQEFLREINNTKETLDIAAYGWVSVPEIDAAIQKAIERGVRMRLVYDFTAKKSYYPDTVQIARFAQTSKNDLKTGDKTLSEYLMHNKFMIFDGKKVATGSLNYSKTDFSAFNSNFILFIESPEIARIYTDELEQMLSGKFHTDKEKRKNYERYKLQNSEIEVYFSPQDRVISEKVLDYIRGAKKYIYIPTFVITHKGLEAELIAAKERGVEVKLIVDATNVYASKSSVQKLRAAGIPVKVENYAGKLHSKSIIIDDEVIIAGSMNFSNSGENKNDENLLIVKNKRLTLFYRDFFNYLWGKIPDKYLTRAPRAESFESLGSCTDGIDNDFDGRIDNADEGCFK